MNLKITLNTEEYAMSVKEMLVIMFEKDIGVLKQESEIGSEDSIVYSLTFLHKNKITIKILLFQTDLTHWVIHHELSKEHHRLVKKIIRVCTKIKRIKTEDQLLLSKDLLEIQKENFIKNFSRSILQNFLNKHFTLFK
jgi:hypothetical protein